MILADFPDGPGLVAEDSIRRLLNRFYGRVRNDAQLGPVFAKAVSTLDADWVTHLARLADFWSSVMLRSGRYHGDHLRLPDLTSAMFDRWLALFRESCVEVLEPNAADAFRELAGRIAHSRRMDLFERLPGNVAETGLP